MTEPFSRPAEPSPPEEEPLVQEGSLEDLRAVFPEPEPAPLRALPREEREAPQDIPAELALLGACIMFPDDVHAVFPVVEPADFYSEAHRLVAEELFTAIEDGRPHDSVSLLSALSRKGRIHRSVAMDLIIKIMDSAPTAVRVAYHAASIREAALRRRLLQEAGRLEAAARNGASVAEAVDSTRAALEDVGRRAATGDDGEDACTVLALPDLLRLDVPEPEPLVGAHVLDRGGLGMIVSEEGAGKTHLGLDLALSLSRGGGRFLGLSMPKDPVRTLFLWGEGGLFGARDRLRVLVADGKAPPALRLVVPRNLAPDLSTAEGVARVRRYIEEHKAEALLVDTLSEFSSHDENDSTASKLLLRRINGLRRSLGVTVVLSHHTRKAGEGSIRGSAREARGPTVLPGAADAVLSLNREPDGRLLATWSKLRACAPLPALLLQFHPEEGRFAVVGEKAPAAPARSNGDRVLDALRDAGTWQTYAVLEKALRMSRRTLERALEPLVSSGVVEKAGGAPSPVMFRLAGEVSE